MAGERRFLAGVLDQLRGTLVRLSGRRVWNTQKQFRREKAHSSWSPPEAVGFTLSLEPARDQSVTCLLLCHSHWNENIPTRHWDRNVIPRSR